MKSKKNLHWSKELWIYHSFMEVSNPRSILDFDAHGFDIINYKTTQIMNKLNIRRGHITQLYKNQNKVNFIHIKKKKEKNTSILLASLWIKDICICVFLLFFSKIP
jgi:hypothetical protein